MIFVPGHVAVHESGHNCKRVWETKYYRWGSGWKYLVESAEWIFYVSLPLPLFLAFCSSACCPNHSPHPLRDRRRLRHHSRRHLQKHHLTPPPKDWWTETRKNYNQAPPARNIEWILFLDGQIDITYFLSRRKTPSKGNEICDTSRLNISKVLTIFNADIMGTQDPFNIVHLSIECW